MSVIFSIFWDNISSIKLVIMAGHSLTLAQSPCCPKNRDVVFYLQHQTKWIDVQFKYAKSQVYYVDICC